MGPAEKVGVEDAVLLEPLSEAAFVANLERRLRAGRMYTWIGEVLVSVNPYKALYGGEAGEAALVRDYEGRQIFERPPHVFAVAEAALRSIRTSARDAAVVVSGESGAGKTEASKAIMRYLAAVTHTAHQPHIQRVKEIILRSNCVLEAFGNAKTSRNDNSSRFGKYMAIEFNFRGEPVGGAMEHFLLEKSRLVRQQKGERNFHAFYQLLSLGGVTAPLSSRDPKDHRYLCGGTLEARDGTEGRAVVAAMDWLGLDSEEIWRTLAGVLELGNVDVVAVNGNEESAASGPGRLAAGQAAALLGLEGPELETALTSRLVPSRDELLRRPLTKAEAEDARDALAKALYQRLFAHVVAAINKALRQPLPGQSTAPTDRPSVIGVLDIYGFEIFNVNSFEQLCINYANEQLQQQFIQLVLRTEQEEYAREGIQWTPVEYFDNGPICQLIEKPRTGILAILDEACATVGKVTDETFLEAMDGRLGDSPHYRSRATHSSDKTLEFKRDFRLSHYAGPVTYAVPDFIAKNRDALYLHLSRLGHRSSSPFVSALFPEGAQSETTVSKRPPTAGHRFNSSIKALLDTLSTKTPFYVRCLKPNASKSPVAWERELVSHQVAYLGLMENVRVRRAGFAHRTPYTLFLQRYKLLCPKTWPTWKGGSDRDGVAALLDHVRLTSDVSFGHTKLFIRSPRTLFRLEEERTAAIPGKVLFLQRHWRGTLGRWRAKRTRAVRRIVAAYRRYKLRSHMRLLLERLAGVEKRADLGKGVQWPKPPATLAAFQDKLRLVHQRWRCRVIRSRVPKAEWETFSLKLSALELLRGKRQGDWGWDAAWKRDHVGLGAQAAQLPPHQRLLFASHILKFNHHGKVAERTLVVTEGWVGKVNRKTGKVMESWSLAELERVGLSEGGDGVVVLGFRSYELVAALDSPGASVGELVGRLWAECRHGLRLDVGPAIQVRLGSKTKTLSVRQDPALPHQTFKADQHNLFLIHTGPAHS